MEAASERRLEATGSRPSSGVVEPADRPVTPTVESHDRPSGAGQARGVAEVTRPWATAGPEPPFPEDNQPATRPYRARGGARLPLSSASDPGWVGVRSVGPVRLASAAISGTAASWHPVRTAGWCPRRSRTPVDLAHAANRATDADCFVTPGMPGNDVIRGPRPATTASPARRRRRPLGRSRQR